METVFLTRKQYNEMSWGFKEDPKMLAAYNAAKRVWSAEGVSVTTDDIQLLQLIDFTITQKKRKG